MPPTPQKTTCGHPERIHHAQGKCRQCYQNQRSIAVEERGRGGRRPGEHGGVSNDEAAALRKAHAATEAARQKLLADLGDAKQQIETLTKLSRQRPTTISARKGVGRGKRRQGVPVFNFSDWHIEEPVSPDQVSGLNEYNLDIADKCITTLTDAVEWFARDPRWDMRYGVLNYMGDLWSGYIHEELVEGNLLSPVEAAVWLQPRIERQIRTVLAKCPFETLVITCEDGNHGRLTNKMRVATRTANSLEWLLYKTLAVRFADEKRVRFQIAEGDYNYLNVYDTKVCFFHGDSVKFQGGVGGLLVPLRRGLNELRKYRPADVFVLGHFHQYTPSPDVIVNGSMIGTNAFSMRYKFAPEPRQQSMFIIDSERGNCINAPMWLPQYMGGA